MDEQDAIAEFLEYLERLVVAAESIAESLEVGLANARAFEAANGED